MKYPHLYLTDWPFRVVPDQSFCKFLADRKQLGEDVRALLNHLSRRDVSTIHAMWSWLGAGKTHTLRYIGHLCHTAYTGLVPIYTEFPKGGRSFIDLYRSLMTAFDINVLLDSFDNVASTEWKGHLEKELNQEFPDLAQALLILLMGTAEQQATAKLWLRAENVQMRDVRAIGLVTKIDTPERALQSLSWIIRLISWAAAKNEQSPARLIWLIDELQRIEDFSSRAAREINDCLHGLFNRCPRSFSLILSFTGPPTKNLPPWLSRELADRIGLEQVMILPPLTSDEAEVFVTDVLKQFRPDGTQPPSPMFPFSLEAVRTVVHIAKQKGKELRPRVLMQAFAAVLEVADTQIEAGKIKQIDEPFVRAVLEHRQFQNPDEPEP